MRNMVEQAHSPVESFPLPATIRSCPDSLRFSYGINPDQDIVVMTSVNDDNWRGDQNTRGETTALSQWVQQCAALADIRRVRVPDETATSTATYGRVDVARIPGAERPPHTPFFEFTPDQKDTSQRTGLLGRTLTRLFASYHATPVLNDTNERRAKLAKEIPWNEIATALAENGIVASFDPRYIYNPDGYPEFVPYNPEGMVRITPLDDSTKALLKDYYNRAVQAIYIAMEQNTPPPWIGPKLEYNGDGIQQEELKQLTQSLQHFIGDRQPADPQLPASPLSSSKIPATMF